MNDPRYLHTEEKQEGDYRFGYDITLASEHSIAKKLSDNWQNEWEAEDDEI